MKVCSSCWMSNEVTADKCKYCGGAKLLAAAAVVGRDSLPDVSGLVLKPGDGVVRGFWDFVGTGGEVRVFRREGSPPSELGGGEPVELIGPHSFEDRTVHNGRLYYYRVRVEYVNRAGKSVFTPGVFAGATPEPPPQPVEECQLNIEQGILHVTWKPPRFGAVRIYRTEHEPEWRIGDHLTMENLASLGVVLQSSLDGVAVDYHPPETTAFYLPVTIAGELAVMGRPEFYVATPEISKLHARHYGSYIQLQWQWPAGCDLALVTWRDDTYPQSADDPQAHKRKVTRGDYQQQGGFRISEPAKLKYYFVAYAAMKIDGREFYSAGKSSGARFELRPRAPLTVSYSISSGGWLRRWVKIMLKAERDVGSLPEIVLVAAPGDIEPLSIEVGVEVGRVRAASLRANVPSFFSFKADALKRPFRLCAFFNNSYPTEGFELRKVR